MSERPVKVGVIGCGKISGRYLETLSGFDVADVVACADLDVERAQARAKEFGVPVACTVEALLAREDIKLVVNLTIPAAHARVSLSALEAGKSVHSEKPLTVTREDGLNVLKVARAKGLRVGCAPDTSLGAGLQTCRQLIDEGAVGEPVGASAFMLCSGHEDWHPDPAFYYQAGGGPMFDMGPYYLTALVHLLGPVRRVTGSARITFPERTITSEPKRGETISVETPTHVAGVIDFAGGAVGTIVTSFDVQGVKRDGIEIYGTEGTLRVPDPNGFGGPVRLKRAVDEAWRDVEVTRPYAADLRGMGVAELASAILAQRPHRASGELAYHVLDVMHAFLDASAQGSHVTIQSSCERPAPLPADAREGEFEGQFHTTSSA